MQSTLGAAVFPQIGEADTVVGNNSPPFFLSGLDVVDRSGAICGRWIPDQQRVQYDWEKIGIDPEIAQSAALEAEGWDNWAGGEAGASKSGQIAWRKSADWVRRYPIIDFAIQQSRLDLNLPGARILDIGGSGKDAVYWLSDNPGRIDQVEVSPLSQATCLSRIKNFEAAHGGSVSERTFFHTLPAERLPFADNTFDFVFSRSTIHHCRRPTAVDEAVRVLKPGGTVMFIERYLSGPMYALMSAYRSLRRVDRGSDDPLRAYEIEYPRSLLSAYWWVPTGGSAPFRYFLKKFGLAVNSLPEGELPSSIPFADRWFGTKFICIGRK